MKRTLLLAFVLVICPTLRAVDLHPIPHKVVADNRTFERDASDRRYSVWTDAPEKAAALLETFALKGDAVILAKGEILAVFLNDRLEEDLTAIVFNATANEYFADCADSGVRFKLQRLPEGRKYSHLTAVVFSAKTVPSHLGMRGMKSDGLSEKR